MPGMHPHGALELLLIILLATLLAVPLFRRLGLSSVLGYLVAGIAIGPLGLGLLRDDGQILALSESGVVMMLFVIGLELSPARLRVMRREVFAAGGAQVVLSALVIGIGLALLGLDWRANLAIALTLALSSTAVGLQLLSERKTLNTPHGRLTFAVLLFQDMFAIPLLALVPMLATASRLSLPTGTAVPIAIVVIMAVLVLGRWLLRWVLRAAARSGSLELSTAASLAVVAGMAWLFEAIGLSLGLGAFLAGVLLADSEFRHELESHIEPFKGLLLGLFFIAVGMGIDLRVALAAPVLVVGAVLTLLLAKGAVMLLVARATGLDWRESLRIAGLLGMGGEFAFVVFSEAARSALLSAELYARLTLVVGLSMALTPLLLILIERLLKRHPRTEPLRAFDTIGDERPQVIIAGFGRMGQIVARILTAQRIPYTALENSAEQVDFSRRFGNQIYFGDPARPEVLRAAGAAEARLFVLTTDDPNANLRTARLVKRLFPHLRVIARARNRQHAFRLMDLGVEVVRETFHSSLEVGRRALAHLGVDAQQAHERVERFRAHDEALLEAQHLVYDDEAALVASAQEALRDLENLFAADNTPNAPAPERE